MAHLVLEEETPGSELALSLNGLPLARTTVIRPGDHLRAGGTVLRVADDPVLPAAVREPTPEFKIPARPAAPGTSVDLGDPRPVLASTPELVAEAPCMRRLLATVRKIAAGESTVLIHGESGSGKEVVAQAIRANGPRAKGPFVTVNSASLPETVLESELFGHERGAFTGAITRHEGLFQAASGGTLFLDEIGELALPTQAKLLRALESREIRRLGGTETIKVDVRLITATHRDLRRAAARGQFREDLLYRIAVVELRIPPLRERREDLEPLVRCLLERIAREQHRKTPSLAPDAFELIRAYPFPGNVRELRNALESGFNFCEGGVIRLADLPRHLHQQAEPSGGFKTLAEIERDHIESALIHARWNKSRAASLLGIDRKTLYLKIDHYGLRPVAPAAVEELAAAESASTSPKA